MIRLTELPASEPVRIIFHGTGAGHPSAERFGSSATIRSSGGATILIDAGDSVPRRLIADGVNPASVGACFISHTHPDHWVGLPGLVMSWDISERTDPVVLNVPAGSAQFFESVLQGSWLQARARSYDLIVREFGDGDRISTMSAEVRPVPTSHLDRYRSSARPGSGYPSFLFRIGIAGTTLLFSQDLGSEDDLADHLSGVDLLVCEGSHVDLDASVGMAGDCGVGVMVVTHIGPGDEQWVERLISDRSSSNENPRVIVATDGLEIELGSHDV